MHNSTHAMPKCSACTTHPYLVCTTFCHALISTVHNFCVACQYLLRTNFVSRTNILRALYSLHYTMSRFIALTLHQYSLAPPIILLHSMNIQHVCTAYQRCTRTNKFALRSAKTPCTCLAHHIIRCAPQALHHMMLNFSALPHTPILCAHQQFYTA
jgi:hypothetical protein